MKNAETKNDEKLNSMTDKRPEKVDLEQFDGMPDERKSGISYTEKETRIKALAIKSLPAIILDLQTTRGERDRLVKVVSRALKIIEITINLTSTDDNLDVLCDLNIESRALLRDLGVK